MFDLDGTLADTGRDLAAVLNQLLVEEGRSPLPYEVIRPQVSNGAMALLSLGFGQDDAVNEKRLTTFLALYQEQLCIKTGLFDGIDELLSVIETSGLLWGVVTNKPGYLTDPLMVQLDLAGRSSVTVSGDTLAQKKPHPAQLHFACDQLGIVPAQAIYLGDALRDIEAGQRAGMTTVAAAWGYLAENEDINAWQADFSLQHPKELIPLLFDV